MAPFFRNLVKIPGKDFSNLDNADVSDMIEAYLTGGNHLYEDAALTEFMLIPNKIDQN